MDRNQFKVHVLAKCAEAGLTVEETTQFLERLLEKPAFFGEKALGGAVNFAKDTVLPAAESALWKGVVPLLTLGPPAIGAAAGYGLARAQDYDHSDMEDARERELLDLYNSYIERAKLSKIPQQL